jgi:hypothetical protein
MQDSFVAMFNIGETLIPCERVLGIIHVQDMHDNSIFNLSFPIYLRVEDVDLVSLVSSSDQRID